jgi:hypothetical protein
MFVPRRIQEMFWEEKNFSPETMTSIWMKVRKWVDMFIKNHITRNINPTTSNIQTLKPFVHYTVTQENTPFQAELEFVRIVRA